MFEGCSSGGNRFDLGILSYFPQIWASDDTDALCRAEIQTGYSYGYPMSVVGAHVSKDQKKAVGLVMQKLVAPNTQFEYYKSRGLASNLEYHFYNCSLKYNVKEFGDLVNTVTPVHIKQESLIHNLVAKFMKMDGEIENCYAYGDTLMYSGVKLKQAFGGTGYNDEVRYFQDFSSRIYFMEAQN